MSILQANVMLNCEGMACPMPVVRTKQKMGELKAGEVLEVRATDVGSLADLQSWAERTGQQYIGWKEEDKVYRHFIRKVDSSQAKEEVAYPDTISLSELAERLAYMNGAVILDVREPAEYAFGHIPGALSIPAGQLEKHLDKLEQTVEYLVICRTGNRSNRVCQTLVEKGFSQVKNVLPGMTEWTGAVEQTEQ